MQTKQKQIVEKIKKHNYLEIKLLLNLKPSHMLDSSNLQSRIYA